MKTLRDVAVRLNKEHARLLRAEQTVQQVSDSFGQGESVYDSAKRLSRAKRHLAKVKRQVLGVLTTAKNLVVGKRKTPYPRCPHCRVPIRGWVGLVKHLHLNHGWTDGLNGYLKCPCGIKTTPGKVGTASMARHLAGQADLKTHLDMAKVAGNGKPLTEIL